MSAGNIYGPHTLQVQSVIDRIANLTKGQVLRLGTAEMRFLPMNTSMDYRLIKQEMYAVSAVAAAWGQWEQWRDAKFHDFIAASGGAKDSAERRFVNARSIAHNTIVAIIFQMDIRADVFDALTSIWAEVVAPIPAEAKQ